MVLITFLIFLNFIDILKANNPHLCFSRKPIMLNASLFVVNRRGRDLLEKPVILSSALPSPQLNAVYLIIYIQFGYDECARVVLLRRDIVPD